jgi:hypothetical protein
LARPSLGSVKEVSLKEARLARDAARLRVKGDRSTPGVDIVQEKRAAREEAKAVEIKVTLPTFEQCAEVYIRERWSTWSKKHRNQWPSSLKRYAYPTIEKLTIPEIKPSHIYELLRPIWVEKRETANRVRGRIETIVAKNADVDDTDFRNPAELTNSCARSFQGGPNVLWMAVRIRAKMAARKKLARRRGHEWRGIPGLHRAMSGADAQAWRHCGG